MFARSPAVRCLGRWTSIALPVPLSLPPHQPGSEYERVDEGGAAIVAVSEYTPIPRKASSGDCRGQRLGARAGVGERTGGCGGGASRSAEQLLEERAGVRGGVGRHLLGGPLGDDAAALVAA